MSGMAPKEVWGQLQRMKRREGCTISNALVGLGDRRGIMRNQAIDELLRWKNVSLDWEAWTSQRLAHGFTVGGVGGIRGSEKVSV